MRHILSNMESAAFTLSGHHSAASRDMSVALSSATIDGCPNESTSDSQNADSVNNRWATIMCNSTLVR